TSPQFVEEAGMGYRKLAVAVLDEDRRILRASSEFNIPVPALPEKAIPIEAIPDRMDTASERELRARFGALSRQWTAPDGRWYQVLLARLSLDDTPEDFLESTLAFNNMLDRLQDSFKRLSEFSSDLAHDLRTPINNLLGEAQVALSRPREAAEYRAVLESAVEEYERLS